MMKMDNLPTELLEEILSRVPVTSLRRIQLTCKKWETLFKDGNFTKKHPAQQASERKGEILTIVLINCKLSLMSVNLKSDYLNPSIRHRGNLISLNHSDQLDITRIYHCDGLVLCDTEDYTRLVVWNPYTGQTQWIGVKPIPDHHEGNWYNHALGYDKSTHKVLRFAHPHSERSVHEIYVLSTNSWRVLDITSDWKIDCNNYGVSLMGNTYWYAEDEVGGGSVPGFLLCFDFTRERYGPRLPLPFESDFGDSVTLSTVREEKLAVLYQMCGTYEMEVWVTTKIEPNAVSWSKFLAVVVKPVTGVRFYTGGDFIVDEEKRAVVVFDESVASNAVSNSAYFIGENGYFGRVDLGEVSAVRDVIPHALSYVPSSVHFNHPE